MGTLHPLPERLSSVTNPSPRRTKSPTSVAIKRAMVSRDRARSSSLIRIFQDIGIVRSLEGLNVLTNSFGYSCRHLKLLSVVAWVSGVANQRTQGCDPGLRQSQGPAKWIYLQGQRSVPDWHDGADAEQGPNRYDG